MSALKFAAFAALPLLLGACSQDRHTFHSTVHLPATVQVVDTARHMVVWSKEVPVGHKLVVDLDRPPEFEPAKVNMRPATRMTYRLYEPATGWHVKGNGALPRQFVGAYEHEHVTLPGTPLMLRVQYRPGPEYPPGWEPPEVVEEPPPVPARG